MCGGLKPRRVPAAHGKQGADVDVVVAVDAAVAVVLVAVVVAAGVVVAVMVVAVMVVAVRVEVAVVVLVVAGHRPSPGVQPGTSAWVGHARAPAPLGCRVMVSTRASPSSQAKIPNPENITALFLFACQGAVPGEVARLPHSLGLARGRGQQAPAREKER